MASRNMATKNGLTLQMDCIQKRQSTGPENFHNLVTTYLISFGFGDTGSQAPTEVREMRKVNIELKAISISTSNHTKLNEYCVLP